MHLLRLPLIVFAFLFTVPSLKAQSIYFPPINNNAFWDTLSPQSLGWCTEKTDSLYQYLQEENTKAFLVLKDGKIVLEKYFGSFSKDSIWYWASASKTITSFLIGKAKEDGILKLSDSSSRFLGVGWTNETPLKEGKITIRNQLTMTTGLDDGVPDNHCTIDTCLNYLADAGNRWAYHNAPYTLLEKVLVNASGQAINAYTQVKLKNQTGITGLWFTSNYDNVFYSKARSMARFGILAQNKFNWNGTSLLTDTGYINQMTRTSQSFNKSYGYLWWLNGKTSFMAPTSQFLFPGSYAPQAPTDMYAAIGKNGQILSIAPSSGIVFVRMGDASNGNEVPFLLCNNIWIRLNSVICNSTSTSGLQPNTGSILGYPNPASEEFHVDLTNFGIGTQVEIEVFNVEGKVIFRSASKEGGKKAIIPISDWKPGIYHVIVRNHSAKYAIRMVKKV